MNTNSKSPDADGSLWPSCLETTPGFSTIDSERTGLNVQSLQIWPVALGNFFAKLIAEHTIYMQVQLLKPRPICPCKAGSNCRPYSVSTSEVQSLQ